MRVVPLQLLSKLQKVESGSHGFGASQSARLLTAPWLLGGGATLRCARMGSSTPLLVTEECAPNAIVCHIPATHIITEEIVMGREPVSKMTGSPVRFLTNST